MKKYFSLFLAAVCALGPISASAVGVNMNNTPVVMDTEPAVVNGRTLVPMRPIFEGLGAEVEWDGATKGITASRGDKTISLYLNDTVAYINGESHQLDTPAVLINGRTMVPARFVAESLDCFVFWEPYEKCVSIFTDAEQAAAYDAKLQQMQAVRKAEAERIAAEKAEAERIAAEKAEAERIAAQKAEAEQARQGQAKAAAPKSRTVYITKTGKRYHYNNSCNGGTYYASTMEDALQRGLTPCHKCVQ